MVDPKREREENINEFDRVFDAAVESGKAGGSIEDVYDYSEHVTRLGIEIAKWFSEAERDRRDVEQRWLKDLRQYRGEYDPDIKAKMHPKRSKASNPVLILLTCMRERVTARSIPTLNG